LLTRLSELYEAFSTNYNANGEMEDDGAFIANLIWGDIQEEDRKNPDCPFLMNICFGPWRVERQKRVWKKVYEYFRQKCQSDLRNLTQSIRLGFPFDWQRKRAQRMAGHLRTEGKSLSDFLDRLANLPGAQIRDEIARVIHAKEKKTISTFIRDFVSKDVFPIDSRVGQMLSYLGLPRDEDTMIVICRAVGANPRVLNRMFYRHFGEYCNEDKCDKCFVVEECYHSALMKHLSEGAI